MQMRKSEQWPIKPPVQEPNIKFGQEDDYLLVWIEHFLMDRKSQGFSKGTLYFYTTKLQNFIKFCDSQAITRITQITPDAIRLYLLWLIETGHNPGGVHQMYRTLKTFLLWWESEMELEGWSNPIRKVKAPKLPIQPLHPVTIETVQAMLESIRGNSMTEIRDRAILLALLDTGLRANELLDVNLGDVDPIGGSILVVKGKGQKTRNVFLGKKARKALRAYLKVRQAEKREVALWVTPDGERLSYWGLRMLVQRRANRARVERPSIHDFRRAFALNFLRQSPGEIYSLQKLMGHADLQVLRRYLDQTDDDIRDAHQRGSPVDNLL